MKLLGTRIGDVRRRARRPAKEVAKAAGISRGHLSQIEHGQKTPSMQVLLRLAAGLGVSAAYLLADEHRLEQPGALEVLERQWPLTDEEHTLLAAVCLHGRRPATPEAYLLVLLAMRHACTTSEVADPPLTGGGDRASGTMSPVKVVPFGADGAA
ncbi:MAG: helix-turn-helix domain-containing protein [Chloroflexi bacterium]|nr:helix-turn-helix domain-containing protein [Chloroflexota bacterium]